MHWMSLSRLNRATALTLIGMALAHAWATLAREGELPAFAIVFELVLVGLGVLALTGRWFSTAIAAVSSGAVGVVSAFGARAASPPLEGTEAIAVVVFLCLALVGLVSGLTASLQIRRSRRQAL